MNLALVAQLGDLSSGKIAGLLVVIAIVIIISGFLLAMASRFKRCPPNRILVKYGKTGKGRSATPIHGGATWVLPLIHAYDFLELEPLQIEIPLEGALSAENIRVSVPSVFTVAIGTEEEIMNNAAIRLLGLQTPQIVKQAEDIIFGQLRHVIASMTIQEINRDRDVFLEKVQSALEPELKKIGLVLINVNIRDIKDESGYIEAIGRKAASTAIQQAEIDVAEQNKRGAIGVAEAERERAVSVAGAEKVRDIGTKEADRERAVRLAELEKEKSIGEQTAKYEQESQLRDKEREMRVRVADANAKAVSGENKSKAEVAAVNAELRVKEAEAFERGEKRFREAQAAVLEAQYRAEARAAAAQAEKIEADARQARGHLQGREGEDHRRRRGPGHAAQDRGRGRGRGDLRQARGRGARPVRDPGEEGRGPEAHRGRVRRFAGGLPDAHARAPRPPVGDGGQGHLQREVRQGRRVGRPERRERR